MIFEDAPGVAGQVAVWGHPWHGLWKAGDGKIHVPDGPVIDTPGQSPSHGPLARESRIGDAWKVQPPGTAAVARTPAEAAADAAAGRTWLNYAILSGSSKRLYGKALHPNAFESMRVWIYVDPDGGRWLVRLTLSSLTVSRFGHFPKDASEPAAAQSVLIDLDLLFPYTAARLFAVEDVTPSGDKALIAFASLTAFPDDERRRLFQVWEIVLSGKPPAMTVGVTEVYRMSLAENGDHEYTTISSSSQSFGRKRFKVADTGTGANVEWFVFDSNGAPTYQEFADSLPAGRYISDEAIWFVSTVGESVREIATPFGACFVDGAATIIKLVQRLEETITATIDDAALEAGVDRVPFSQTRAQTWTATLRLQSGGPAVGSTASGTFVRSGLLGDTDAMPPLVTEETWSRTASIDGTPIPDATEFLDVGMGSVSGFRYTVKRLGSGCWSLAVRNGNDDSRPGAKALGHFHRGVVGLVAAQPMARNLPVSAVDLHGFASAHPHTGEIDWDASEARCWV